MSGTDRERKDQASDELPILEKRRIEAAILKHVFDVIEARSGRAEAEAVIGEAVQRSAVEQGRYFRDKLGREPDLLDFNALSALWEAGGALEREVLVASAERLEYNMTRCAYAEMYREMGLEEIGHLLSCNRDGTFCVGYNPKMRLTRNQTIMQGASHCDFRYRMVEEGDA